MNRRLPHTPATPARTGGDDRPAGACYGISWPFDTLIDLTAGPAFKEAQRAARDLCSGCPIMAECLTANRAEGWAKAVMGRRKPTVSPRRQRQHIQHHDERLVELRKLVDQGATLEGVLEHFGLTTRHQLYKWCHRHGHLDLWRHLTPHLKANQHRRKSVAA